ncbi:hypothetical protein IFM89_028829 [Coptis chinensis]|uniref:Aminotransferase class V domain-containing protein n=1 Tax=Coptis chinensis TaxID=261450 RepID=A0A835LIY1_9MAGN|nr:hypothetical protein IFM89_028829 [Coptis chinensis]
MVVPPYIDSSEIVRRGWKRYNLSLGPGLNKVAGKGVEIGHLGNVNEIGTIYLWSYVYKIVRISSTKKMLEVEVNGSINGVPEEPLNISRNSCSDAPIPSNDCLMSGDEVDRFALPYSLDDENVVIVGFIVGVVAPFRRLMIGESAPLHVIQDFASLLGVSLLLGMKYIAAKVDEYTRGMISGSGSSLFEELDHYRHPALFLVDGVSSICALDFRMDEWGIDVALTGSQKALSLPTGMGIVCASPKALEATKTAKSRKSFL